MSHEIDSTEADLWANVLNGDGSAFAVLFDRHHARVFRHVLGLLGPDGEADDIAAATFLEFWRRRKSVRVVEGSVLPWLLVTAGYLARNNGRKSRNYKAVLQRLPRSLPLADPAEEAEVHLESHRRAGRIALAMKKLQPIDAQLIALTALEDYSISDAASALGMTAGNARVRLHRARVKLRSVLDDPELMTNGKDN